MEILTILYYFKFKLNFNFKANFAIGLACAGSFLLVWISVLFFRAPIEDSLQSRADPGSWGGVKKVHSDYHAFSGCSLNVNGRRRTNHFRHLSSALPVILASREQHLRHFRHVQSFRDRARRPRMRLNVPQNVRI